jgi:hypothetical protein
VENRDERMAISCERFSIEMLITKSSVPELLFAFSGDGGDPTAKICFSQVCLGSMGRDCKQQGNGTENQVLTLT